MSPTEIIPSLQLNTRGLRCPEPVMMLHQAIRKSKAGDVETMGGLLLQEIGLVSDLEGQTIELENWQFTILEADSRSIHLIRAVRQ